MIGVMIFRIASSSPGVAGLMSIPKDYARTEVIQYVYVFPTRACLQPIFKDRAGRCEGFIS